MRHIVDHASAAMLGAAIYTPEPSVPSRAENAARRLQPAVEYVNQLLRELHGAGKAVLVAEVHECTKADPMRPLPQLRVEIRAAGDTISRPESLDP